MMAEEVVDKDDGLSKGRFDLQSRQKAVTVLQ